MPDMSGGENFASVFRHVEALHIANPASEKILVSFKAFVRLQLTLRVRTGSIDQVVINVSVFNRNKY